MGDPFREQLIEALGRNYTLDRELTGGGMSRVFIAREHALSRTVVVKVLGPELAADVNRERFRREIMLAAQLQHPLIVPVLSAGEDRELLWYTMPFVEGESLREEIRRGPATVRSAMRVLHDVLDALAYAHARGVVHRDIKPGNILRHGTHSLVTDFGVAKALSASLPSSGTTSAGIAIGTPAYMAPEQLAADPGANHRMDIYAVGLLMYELFTGTQAFAESSPQATLAAQLTRMPKNLAEVRPDVPPTLSALIMRMLAKNPNDRPQSASAALEELDTIVTPTGTTSPYRTGGRSYMRSPALAMAALSIVVAGIAVALVQQRKSSATRDTAATVTATPPPPAPPQTKLAPTTGAAAPTTSAARPKTAGTKTPATKAPAAGSASAKTVTAAKSADVKVGVNTKAGAATKTPSAATRVVAPPPPLLNRRVAVLPIRVNSTRENVAAAAQAIDDSIRKALVAAGYTLATDSELLRLVTQQNMVGGGLRRAADAAGMGAVVTIDVVARGDEVSAVMQVLDVWRAQSGSVREAADIDKPMDLLSVVRQVTRGLDRVSWRSKTDPKRVLLFEVANLTGVDSLVVRARQLEDSVRAVIGGAGAASVPLDSALRATRDVVERRQLAVRRGAGAIIDACLCRWRADSLLIRLSVRDMSEERTFPNVETRVPLRALDAGISEAMAKLAAVLAQVNWGPKVAP